MPDVASGSSSPALAGRSKLELIESVGELLLLELEKRLLSGEATASEINTATQMYAKSGLLTRTAGAGKSGDEWMDMVMAMPDEEFDRFVLALRERRADARSVAATRKKAGK